MAKPFTCPSLIAPSFFQKVLGRQPKENAMLALQFRLGQAARISDIPLDFLLEVSREYRADLTVEFRTEQEDFYSAYLLHCFEDRVFQQDEIDDLWHLKNLLSIDDPAHERLYQQCARFIYRREVNDVLADLSVSDQERSYLERMRSYLAIGDNGTVIEREEADRALIARLDSMPERVAITPHELAIIHHLSQLAGRDIPPEYQERLQLACDLWTVQSAQTLQSIPCGINLLPGEICHYSDDGVYWSEPRSERVTHSTGGGLSLRVKIVKGLYWNCSQGRTYTSSSREISAQIGIGQAYLTNKRVIIVTPNRTKAIKLPKIVDIEGLDYGVRISPDTGRSVFLTMLVAAKAQLFTAYLGRILRDN